MGYSHIDIRDWMFEEATPSGIAIPDAAYCYWKLDEASGDAVDALGNKDLTMVGTVAANSGGIFGNYRYGFNDSNYLNGVGTDIDTHFDTDGTATFMVDGFIYIDPTITDTGYQVYFGTTAQYTTLSFDASTAPSGKLAAYQGTAAENQIFTTDQDFTGSWHHVLFAKTGTGTSGTLLFYLDGALVGTGTGASSAYTNYTLKLGRESRRSYNNAPDFSLCDFAWCTNISLLNIPGDGTLAERIADIATKRWNSGIGLQYTVS